MVYQWVLLMHILSVTGFLAAHGVSIVTVLDLFTGTGLRSLERMGTFASFIH